MITWGVKYTENFSTKSWIIGILAGAWVATFVVGYLHSIKVLTESENPVIHTFVDWIFVIVFLLPISYGLARMIASK